MFNFYYDDIQPCNRLHMGVSLLPTFAQKEGIIGWWRGPYP